MSSEVRHDGVLWIEEYSLKDLVLGVQKGVQEGYEVSLDNQNYPQGFSGHFTVGMVKPAAVKQQAPAAVLDPVAVPEAPETATSEVKQPARARKPAASA